MDLRMDEYAWRAGFRAGAAGRERSSCPYPSASGEASSWQSGFIEGTAKREGREYSLGPLTPEEARREGL
jgi:ribosome modulation factor